MVFSNSLKSLNGPVILNNSHLKQVRDTRFLGVNIDCDLSWKYHVSEICKLISRNTGVLYRLRDFFPKRILRNLYCTLILPYLNYGILVWGNCANFQLDKILKIQHRSIRIINHVHFYSNTNSFFHADHVLKVPDIYFLNLGTFMYQLSKNDLPDIFTSTFQRNDLFHNYPTRHSHSFHLPRARTLFSQKSFLYAGPKFWNDLPRDIIESPSLFSFRRKLKQLLLNSYSVVAE